MMVIVIVVDLGVVSFIFLFKGVVGVLLVVGVVGVIFGIVFFFFFFF